MTFVANVVQLKGSKIDCLKKIVLFLVRTLTQKILTFKNYFAQN